MTKKTNSKNKKDESSGFDFKTLITSSQFRAIMGVLTLVAALAVFMALVSFFFTGAEDQSFVTSQAENCPAAKNWTGSFGAYISNWLINGLFGVSALVVPFILMILALLLMGVKVQSLVKCLVYPLLILIWLPITLSVIFTPLTETFWLSMGGGYGEMMDNLLRRGVGLPGEILVLVGLFVAFGFVAFGWSRFLNGKTFAMPTLRKSGGEVAQGVASAGDAVTVDVPEEDTPEEIVEEPVIIDNKPEGQEDDVEVVVGPEDDGKDDTPSEGEVIIIESGKTDDEPKTEPEDEDDADGDEIIVVEGPKEEKERDLLAELGPYDPTLDLSYYKFPSPELLKDFSNQNGGVSPEEQHANQQKIISTLKNFNIGVKKIVETIGPTVTLFEIIPEDGVRIAKIRGLEKDIMLSLSATGIRLIAPMPGKGTIGIEVPNSNPKTVGMRSLITSTKFKEYKAELPVVMGRTITNGVFTFDLAKTPHLIVAGATGQGKSVGLNAIITSLLYTKHPSQVKFVLIDPKQLEFSIYRDIECHYLAKLSDADDAVITDSKKVIKTLEAVCQEMEDRYYLLSIAKVRNIVEYNRKFVERRLNPNYGHRYLPYIVVIVDEFGDLIATEGKKIETPIQRITQKARAAGIHMILATQRPSVNVITGVIKANCPTRIAFRVISKIDSMTILDTAGADQLIGRGDMLYSKGDAPERVQCAFVDTPEVEEIVSHIKSQQSYPDAYILPEPKSEEGDFGESGDEGGGREFSIRHCDSLFNEVAEYVVSSQVGSTSSLQRKFEIGFNRAGKLMDQLERAGIVGPARGSKPRDVLIKNIDDLNALIASYFA